MLYDDDMSFAGTVSGLTCSGHEPVYSRAREPTLENSDELCDPVWLSYCTEVNYAISQHDGVNFRDIL